MSTAVSRLPIWVNQQQFIDVVKSQIKDLKNITHFNAVPALRGGENYLTLVLRVNIDLELQDESSRNVKYILKIPLQCGEGKDYEFHDLFVTESEMYRQIIPELETLYCDYAEMIVKFKPQHFEFTESPQCDYILMEDLRERGYENLNRLVGLEQSEIEAVLKKLAQWHAASAKRVEAIGCYGESYERGYFHSENREMLDHMNAAFSVPFLECLERYELTEEQRKLIRSYNERLTDLYIKFGQVNEKEFNVLNHGDFWCNNFMFRYEADKSAIDDICFVDFQLPKYGTPAQDLFCLLMTTPKMEIKLEKFDHFIEYYHEQLVRHLKLLKYDLKIPTLQELQESLQINGLWAYVCAQRMLPVALLESSDDANAISFMSQSEEGMAFKKRLLLNPSYVKQINIIFPWLIKRRLIK